MIRQLCAVLLLHACSATLSANELTGIWQNEEQPAWIELQEEAGVVTATVRRNDNKPEAVGRILLKNVVADPDKPGLWQGQIYAERLKEYKDASISLPSPEQLRIDVKVGFFSRSIGWQRVAAVPAAGE